MTIEIEAGASQSQFSMKPSVVHAFFGGGTVTVWNVSHPQWKLALPITSGHCTS